MIPAEDHDYEPAQNSARYVHAMESLVGIVQDLSHAREIEGVMAIVRKAARKLTKADGATFILRDGDKCFYADEDAVSPLWKGQRFPMESCISGWVMRNARPAVLEDIYKDARIPIDAYKPTFVKSMVMVPIRAERPIGAIGNYWAETRKPEKEEVAILQALAHVTSVAMENVELYSRLQKKLRALETSNREIVSFAWAVAHDLRSPLRAIDNLAEWVGEDIRDGDGQAANEKLKTLKERVGRMEDLLNGILEYSHQEAHLDSRTFDDLVRGDAVIEDLRGLVDIPAGFLLSFEDGFKDILVPRKPFERVLTNLVDNAIKHHDRPQGSVAVSAEDSGSYYTVSVRDDGPGIPFEYHEKIFEIFQTLKPRDKKEGSGIGLALVRKTLAAYGGEIFVESSGRGTVFRFTWPKVLFRKQ